MSTITIPKIVELVNTTRHHQIRQGHTHRFIDLMFVTVGERLFCRRYTYSEPSWRSAFIKNAIGQIKLDDEVIDVKGVVPHDLDKINPLVNKAYEEALKRYGATYLLDGAIDHRAQESTMEMIPVIT